MTVPYGLRYTGLSFHECTTTTTTSSTTLICNYVPCRGVTSRKVEVGQVAYAASKGAMLAMTRGLAVELARYGITANTIIPGWIETAMTAPRVGNELFEDRVMKRVPVRRWGQPSDFAGIAIYLASEASSYQTGEEFVIDGGYTRF